MVMRVVISEGYKDGLDKTIEIKVVGDGRHKNTESTTFYDLL